MAIDTTHKEGSLQERYKQQQAEEQAKKEAAKRAEAEERRKEGIKAAQEAAARGASWDEVQAARERAVAGRIAEKEGPRAAREYIEKVNTREERIRALAQREARRQEAQRAVPLPPGAQRVGRSRVRYEELTYNVESFQEAQMAGQPLGVQDTPDKELRQYIALQFRGIAQEEGVIPQYSIFGAAVDISEGGETVVHAGERDLSAVTFLPSSPRYLEKRFREVPAGYAVVGIPDPYGAPAGSRTLQVVKLDPLGKSGYVNPQKEVLAPPASYARPQVPEFDSFSLLGFAGAANPALALPGVQAVARKGAQVHAARLRGLGGMGMTDKSHYTDPAAVWNKSLAEFSLRNTTRFIPVQTGPFGEYDLSMAPASRRQSGGVLYDDGKGGKMFGVRTVATPEYSWRRAVYQGALEQSVRASAAAIAAKESKPERGMVGDFFAGVGLSEKGGLSFAEKHGLSAEQTAGLREMGVAYDITAETAEKIAWAEAGAGAGMVSAGALGAGGTLWHGGIGGTAASAIGEVGEWWNSPATYSFSGMRAATNFAAGAASGLVTGATMGAISPVLGRFSWVGGAGEKGRRLVQSQIGWGVGLGAFSAYENIARGEAVDVQRMGQYTATGVLMGTVAGGIGWGYGLAVRRGAPAIELTNAAWTRHQATVNKAVLPFQKPRWAVADLTTTHWGISVRSGTRTRALVGLELGGGRVLPRPTFGQPSVPVGARYSYSLPVSASEAAILESPTVRSMEIAGEISVRYPEFYRRGVMEYTARLQGGERARMIEYLMPGGNIQAAATRYRAGLQMLRAVGWDTTRLAPSIPVREALAESPLFQRPGAAQAVRELVAAERAQVFGSMSQKAWEGSEYVFKPHDIDLLHPNPEQLAGKIVRRLGSIYGEEIRVSPEKGSLVEIWSGQRWVHGFDIHSPFSPEGYELASRAGYIGWGAEVRSPVYTEEGIYLMSLQEQTARKGVSSLTPRPFGPSPESHRLKDPFGFISGSKYIAAKSGNQALMAAAETFEATIPRRVMQAMTPGKITLPLEVAASRPSAGYSFPGLPFYGIGYGIAGGYGGEAYPSKASYAKASGYSRYASPSAIYRGVSMPSFLLAQSSYVPIRSGFVSIFGGSPSVFQSRSPVSPRSQGYSPAGSSYYAPYAQYSPPPPSPSSGSSLVGFADQWGYPWPVWIPGAAGYLGDSRPRRKRGKQERAYQPSVAAVLLGITAESAPEGPFTGLEIRPMILPKRRRKRGKR